MSRASWGRLGTEKHVRYASRGALLWLAKSGPYGNHMDRSRCKGWADFQQPTDRAPCLDTSVIIGCSRMIKHGARLALHAVAIPVRLIVFVSEGRRDSRGGHINICLMPAGTGGGWERETAPNLILVSRCLAVTDQMIWPICYNTHVSLMARVMRATSGACLGQVVGRAGFQ